MRKKKIIFLIDSEQYIKNYFHGKLYERLKKKFNLLVLINSNSITKESKKYLKNLTYKTYSENKKKDNFNNYFNVIALRNKHKSKYFNIRIKRIYRTDFRLFYENRNFIKVALRIIINNLKIFYFQMLSVNFIYNNYTKKKIFNSSINNNLKSKVAFFMPDLVLKPSNAHSKIEFDLCELSRIYKFKNYFIIDNWDNLSSKTLFVKKPNYLGVWGNQTKKHAQIIQDIKKENIDVIGSARYESFYKSKHKKNQNKNKYILFLGTSWAWNEEAVLDALDIEISFIKKEYENLEIIYRPHPLRQQKTAIDKKRWKNIFYDKQINKKYFSSRIMPNLNYYPKLLSEAIFIIGGLTTMLLESAIFRKKYLAICFDDGKSFLNQKMAINYFPHLENIQKIDSIKLIHNQSQLIDEFRKLIKKNKTHNFKLSSLEKNLDFFLSKKTEYFSKNLINCISKRLN